ncbi:MAG TPA: phosphoenolpyruvate--protein phosphotransferase [Treponema sp.]|nr:phosphoenolpyruvate--protein phosphotransferase [Treponema sp.]
MAMYKIAAVTLSDGTALGSVLNYRPAAAVEERKDIPQEERAFEKKRLEKAVEASLKELEQLADEVRKTLGDDKAAIFECHHVILEDEDFQNDMYALIDGSGYTASYAVQVVAEKNAIEMEELEDSYLRERAADFRDIGQRLISCLGRTEEDSAVFPPAPAVVVADTLSPGETVRFCKKNLLGFIVNKGGRNSHAAILARSIGVPAVVIPENMSSLLKDGMRVVLNMENDSVVVDPDEETCRAAEKLEKKQAERRERLALLEGKPAVTTDGRRFGLYANAGSIRDLPLVAAANPDGIGLYRTEFLFMEQDSLPNEEIQTTYYEKIINTVPGKPVIFRLLDIGGDKPLPYMPHPAEKNPFLGWRGIRFLLDNPDILRTQIRSMLLASAATGTAVRIMVPMVACPSEMEAVKKIIDEEMPRTGGKAVPGMMVETPAAAVTVSAFRGVSGFISIGSNDLTQYTIAVDRESGRLGNLYSEFHPGVLGLMKKAVTDARGAGMETGICGEFASRPEGAALLAGIGFDELSMSPAAIPSVKEIIRTCSEKDFSELVDRALVLPSAEAVRGEAHDFLEARRLL